MMPSVASVASMKPPDALSVVCDGISIIFGLPRASFNVRNNKKIEKNQVRWYGSMQKSDDRRQVLHPAHGVHRELVDRGGAL